MSLHPLQSLVYIFLMERKPTSGALNQAMEQCLGSAGDNYKRTRLLASWCNAAARPVFHNY